MLLSLVVSALLQIGAFAALPFGTYLLTRRRAGGFLAYVGLRPPPRQALGAAAAVAALFTGITLALFRTGPLHDLAVAPNTVIGHLRAPRPPSMTLAALAIYALLQTSLAEELLFRGFIAKRLIARLGFGTGNAVQALLFASVHLLLFVGPGARAFSAGVAAALAATAGLGGWLFGYVNERRGNGSIVPSWAAHGATNFIAYSILTFAPVGT